MKSILYIFLFVTLFCSCKYNGTSKQRNPVQFRIVELPSPNSSTYTFKQAENRKKEILDNHPTPMLKSSKGLKIDFGIHINEDDTITVYNSYFSDGDLERQTTTDIKGYIISIPRWGRAARILITSDDSLRKSAIFPKVLSAIFQPSNTILYAKPK